MNNKIATGIWLVFIGVIILLHNTNVISFNFFVLKDYWPLAIVSIGISLLLQNRPNGPIISTVCNILICSFLVYKGVTYSSVKSYHNSKNYGVGQKNDIDYSGEFETARLQINGGALSYKLVPQRDSSKLAEAEASNSNIDLGLTAKSGDPSKLTLVTEVQGNNNKDNHVSFSLNTKPEWDLEFNVGAASFNTDFSGHKIKSLAVNSGASSMSLKLGEAVEGSSKIDINTGASSMSIRVPKETAYSVVSKNVLSSTSYQGARKIKTGHYQTENFASADRKYIIVVNGAANSISIKTY